MALESLLVLGGPALRLLFRLTGDKTDFGDVTGDIFDLVREVQHTADRRATLRNLEVIADELLVRLDRAVSAEYSNLSEDQRSAVATQTADAMNSALARNRLLVPDNDLQPDRIEAAILTPQVASRWRHDLSESEIGLARLLLRELVHHLTELAARFPNFNVEALTLLLRRTTDLRGLLDEIIETMDALPVRLNRAIDDRSAAASRRALELFDLEYRRAVSRTFDKIEVFGLDLAVEARRYSLTTAYVPLLLRDETTTTDLLHVVPNDGLAVIWGPAGAGKTTLLQWLAVDSARSRSSEARVPFVVTLRQYVNRELPKWRELVEATVGDLIQNEPNGWRSAATAAGGALILVDGLDELGEERTDELVEWLTRLLAAPGKITVVVTSRPSAQLSLTASLQSHGIRFKSAEVLPMERDQVRAFVLHWHASLPKRRFLEGEDLHRTSMAVALRIADKLSGESEYRALARNPLLCAVLCVLFHASRGALPGTRMTIYETLCRVLLETREAQRHIRVDHTGLTYEQRRAILEDLADLMLTNGLTEVDVDRAEQSIARSLERLHVPKLGAGAVLQALVNRAALVRFPSAGHLDFLHRSFLEFLAANSYVKFDRAEALARNAFHPLWNEAAIWATGLGTASQAETIAGEVCLQAEAEIESLKSGASSGGLPADRPSPTTIATCAAILDIGLNLSQTLHDRLRAVLATAIPPRSASDAEVLILAGPRTLPAIAQVLQTTELNARETMHLITLLGEYGTDEARDALSQISPAMRGTCLQQLVKLWPWFDIEAFGESVIAGALPHGGVTVTVAQSSLFPHLDMHPPGVNCDAYIELPGADLARNCEGVALRRLAVERIGLCSTDHERRGSFLFRLASVRSADLRNMVGFAAFEGRDRDDLRHLRIGVTEGVIDCAAFSSMRALETLDISGGQLVNTERLAQLEDLEELRVADLQGCSFDALVNLKVENLTARGLPRTELTELLHHMPGLRRLRLAGISNLKDLQVLSKLEKLSEIEIEDVPDLRDATQLAELPLLAAVRIAGVTDLHDLGSLRLRENVDVDTTDMEQVIAADDYRLLGWPYYDGRRGNV